MKVIFFNQLYDVCRKLGGDYETVRKTMIQWPWIGDSHSIIFHKAYRGYGNQKISKCIPKEISAFTKIVKFPLLEKVDELNNELIKSQNL